MSFVGEDLSQTEAVQFQFTRMLLDFYYINLSFNWMQKPFKIPSIHFANHFNSNLFECNVCPFCDATVSHYFSLNTFQLIWKSG